MSLTETITSALSAHEMDWRRAWEDGDQLQFICSCGTKDFEEDDHRSEVMLVATCKWLYKNAPETDVGYEADGEDDLAWEWQNGFESGTDAVLNLLRKNLTPPHVPGKVGS